jgi:hypothetical protein
MSTVALSPRWDLAVFFPSIESPEFTAAFEKLMGEVADLGRTFDALKVDSRKIDDPVDEQV